MYNICMSKNVWAIVTGASSGIGHEFAHVLAEHGINLILASRNKNALESLALHLSEKHHTKNLVFAADLSVQNNAMDLVTFVDSQKIKPEYVINNAGFGDFGYFTDTKWERGHEMIDLNIKTLTYLTKVYASEMKSRGHGRIVNVASGAAFQPGPLMAIYFASKAYVLHFSEAVAEELAGSGVTVTALCPGPTQSNFWVAAHKPRVIRFFPGKSPTARQVAEYGYEAMMAGRHVAIYGWTNRLATFLVRLAPRRLVTRIIKLGQER